MAFLFFQIRIQIYLTYVKSFAVVYVYIKDNTVQSIPDYVEANQMD